MDNHKIRQPYNPIVLQIVIILQIINSLFHHVHMFMYYYIGNYTAPRQNQDPLTSLLGRSREPASPQVGRVRWKNSTGNPRQDPGEH